ncbi:hypothetical protein [Halorubellus sp. PRR65]|uniref:hypothetical protein n=1 Tax=Halorubellus sp. PRR65 TaxID=3098148 RepID=UPI002B259D6E|nr:hypothetical protein [Halorubellus sp. PRR65]
MGDTYGRVDHGEQKATSSGTTAVLETGDSHSQTETTSNRATPAISPYLLAYAVVALAGIYGIYFATRVSGVRIDGVEEFTDETTERTTPK